MKKMWKQHPKILLPELMRRFYELGLNTSRGGNASMQVEEGRWCTPSALDKAELTPEDMMFLHQDGTVFGKHDVSIETYIHMTIMDRCRDRKAVLHVHDLPVVEFSVMNKAPRTTLYPTCLMGRKIPVTPFAIPGSQELADTLADTINETDSPCAILCNHGAFFAEKNMFRAVETLEALDFLCRTEQSAAGAGMRTLRLIPEDAAELLCRYRARPMQARKDEPLPVKARQMAEKLCALTRRAYRKRLFSINSGIFAARVDARSFLIAPDDVDRYNLMPEDFVLVRDGAIPEHTQQPLYADFCQRLFSAFSKIACVAIAQPAHAMVFACADVPFESKVLPESFSKLRNARHVPFGGLYLEGAEDISHFDPACGPVTIVENECVVCTAGNIFNAFECCELVDEYARIQMHIAQMREKSISLTDDQLAHVLLGEEQKMETDLRRYANRQPLSHWS